MSKQRQMKILKMPHPTVTIRSGKEGNPRNRLLVVTPTLGIVRMEWSTRRFGLPTPCSWAASMATLGIGNVVPMHYLVADAQNLGCKEIVEKDYEWLLLWEDDVIPPYDAYLQLHPYIQKATIPIVSGLYFTKGLYSEPIVYRGICQGAYTNFDIGQKIWVDGVPTGFLLVHSKIIKLMWNESKDYAVLGGIKTREVFETPSKVYFDPQSEGYSTGSGTSDLQWCRRVIDEKVISRAGWPKIGRKKHQFLCDTKIMCMHIDLTSGKQFPVIVDPVKKEK